MPPTRTNGKVERAAQRLLDANGITKPPVPVNRIAEAMNITVAFDDLGGDVSGLLYRRGGTEVIIINQDDNPHRQRFSVAHEIGHADLHDADTYLDGPATLRFRDGKSATGTDIEEREANGFAAALLMPGRWVHDQFIALVSGRRPTDENKAITKLAKDFDVSDQAMRYRLVNLNLIDPT